MSFRIFVRAVEAEARSRGVSLPMAKLRDAIARACYNRPYSACVASEDAETLGGIELPPPFLISVCEHYRVDPLVLGSCITAHADNASKLQTLLKNPIHQQQFCLVFDDSEYGERGLATFLKDCPETFATSFRKNLPTLRMQAPRYVTFLGALSYSGGTSMAAFADKDLLDGVLPLIFERILQRGGACGFIVAVAPEREAIIHERIRALQPVLTNGQLTPPPMLLDLLEEHRPPTVAPAFGGTPISYDSIIFDPSVTQGIVDTFSLVGARWEKAGDTQKAHQAYTPFAEKLPDGSLLLFFPQPEIGFAKHTIPASAWQRRTEAYAQIAGTLLWPATRATTDPIHGGEFVSLDDAIVTNPEIAAQLQSVVAQSLLEWMRDDAPGLNNMQHDPSALLCHEVMPDGSLRTSIRGPFGRLQFVDAPPGSWKRIADAPQS